MTAFYVQYLRGVAKHLVCDQPISTQIDAINLKLCVYASPLSFLHAFSGDEVDIEA